MGRMGRNVDRLDKQVLSGRFFLFCPAAKFHTHDTGLTDKVEPTT